MATCYRFTADELAAMIKLQGVEEYSLLNIDVGSLTDEQLRESTESLCRKQVLLPEGDGYSFDAVIEELLLAIVYVGNVCIREDGIKLVIVGDKIVILMENDAAVRSVWRIYPYQTFVDMTMDGRIDGNDNDRWYEISADGEGYTVWSDYAERMMADE